MIDYNNMKRLTDSPEAVKFMRKFNLKRVVAGRGHDMGGLIADLCIKSKVLADFHDDGRGGEAEVYFKNDAAQEFLTKEFKDNNFAQLVFDNGYEFMEDINRMHFDLLVNALVDGLLELKEYDKIIRKTKNKLVFGNRFNYQEVFWTGLKDLKDLPTAQLQRTYDKYKVQLKDGQKCLNTDEQLLSLGIKL